MRIRVESEVLGANLAVIGARNPRAARAIANAEPLTDIQWHETDDGALSAKLGERWLASRRRPLEEAERFAETIDLESNGCAVVMGFGLGHHIAALAERAAQQAVIVIFEPDVRLLRTVLERINLSVPMAVGMVVLVTDAEDGAALTGSLRGAEAFVTLGTQYAHHAPSVPRLGERPKEFMRTFIKCVSAMRTLIATTLMQSDVTARNQLMNADRYAMCAGINDLKDSAKGRLGVVVSAGPSLRRNLHLLGEPGVRERCAIVAVQTVLKPMLDQGIRPHFVTALDYHEVSRRFYEGLSREDVRGVTLIVEPKANAAILEAWPGDVRVVGDAFLDRTLGNKIVRDRDGLKAGATVAHLAYYVARHLGCDPVALIGQDLAFTDGQYYAKGASIHETWGAELNEFNTLEMMEWQRIVRFRGNLIKLEDHLGRPVFTDEQMATYLAQFESDFLEDNDRGLTIIDATEGGIAKAHTTVRTLRETIDEFASEQTKPMEFPSPQADDNPRTLAKLRDRLRKLARDCARISTQSHETIGLLEEIRDAGDDRACINTLVEKVHVIRDRVERLEAAMSTVQQLSQTAVFKRFKADRLLKLAENLTDLDEHAMRVDRDIANVRWIAEVSEYVSMLLDTAAEATRGGERLTRDLPLDEQAGVVRVITGSLPAIVHAPMRTSAMGVRRDLCEQIDGVPALRRTIEMLNECERVGRVCVVTDDAERARGVVGERVGRLGIQYVQAESLEPPRGVRSSRLFAPTCWRGGLGYATSFDEIIEPVSAARAMDTLGTAHALFVGGDWSNLVPVLCDSVIERHLESPQAHRFVFTPADIGLAGVVHAREQIEQMRAIRDDNALGGLVGTSIGYTPLRPSSDPITRSWCVAVDRSMRLGARRRTSLDADPLHVTLELTTDRRAAHPTGRCCTDRGSMCAETARSIIEQLDPHSRPIALSFAGAGDALLHAEALELIRFAKQRGIAGVHIRTDLLCENTNDLAALLETGVDVVSIDIGASSPETYAQLRECKHYDRVLSNTEWLIHNRTLTSGVPNTWVVPRITRRDEVYEQIEQFYDGWLLVGASPVIDALHAPIDGARIEPLGMPAHIEQRDNRVAFTVLADGTVPVDERNDDSAMIGNAADTPIDTLHAQLISAREASTSNAP